MNEKMEEKLKSEASKCSEAALREEKILEFWKEKNIFQKTLEKKASKGEFVFYEGPPTANAAPALHHLEARAFKDIIPRYKTMRGFHVRRKGGWDTHGLPVELQIEKKLGLKSKKEIETYGIAAFNKQCRESVWEYMSLWDKFTERIGYWVDEKNPYVTYHNSYIESLWNIVSEVNKKKLLYKDYRVVPWCTRCGTALSSHELAQGYDEITDISVYVKFKVVGQDNTYILAWTTTPWTLPGNVGLAVGKDIEYVKFRNKREPETIYFASKEYFSKLHGNTQASKSEPEVSLPDPEYDLLQGLKGSDLVGLSYEPLYTFLSDLISNGTTTEKEKLPNAFKVYDADFVTTTDGTGVVHTAVMYGQEDFELGTKVGLPKFHLVSPDGLFVPGTGFLAGRYVREVDAVGKPTLAIDIIEDLKKRKLFFNKENHKHSYPHCWRCKTALIYYARDSWYIRMSSLREELQAENEKIHWEPNHIKEGRFGEWIREVKDWAISRERYWGTPLPVWATEGNTEGGVGSEFVVIGSLEDLKKRIGRRNSYFLVRHGESESNLHGNSISSTDMTKDPLTKHGIDQAQTSGRTLAGQKIDMIFASPFLRTKQTAENIAREAGYDVGSIVYDDRLREIFAGEYDGKSWNEFVGMFSSTKERFEKSIGGSETWTDIYTRVMKFVYEIDATYSGKNIVIVGHAGPLNLMSLGSKGFSIDEVIEHYNDHDMENAEVLSCDFVALPHNEKFEVDLHRPYIDDIVCLSDSGKPMRRVKEVMDVWFDSGSMPFAQDHYPFENKAWVDGPGYPADFISEAIDQTRGWFYTLLAVGVLMGRGTPYKNVICLGHILDKDGKKMSKSIGNIVNPWDMMDKYGVDALRLWMYSVNQPGDSKNFDEKTVDEIVKKVFNPLSNVYALFALYEKGVERVDPYSSLHPLDVWILARLGELVGQGTEYFDAFKIFEPVRLLRDFIQDFSTWYVRRSRDRFKSDEKRETSEAISVTEYVLIEVAKYIAPMAPFYADWLYLEITKGLKKESVHLEDWPEARAEDESIIRDMHILRDVVSKALELRQKAGIKVRQPLASLTIATAFPKNLLDIIADEVNVKKVEIKNIALSEESLITLDIQITPELRDEGLVRDIIRAVQDARKKENLNPSDKITLIISTPTDLVSLIQKYAEMIQLPTSATKISFSPEKQTYESVIEGQTFTFSISK